MKKCGYCAKEISYHEMYCCDECQDNANRFDELKERYQRIFSVINGIFVISIGVFLFLYSFMHDLGIIGIATALLVLGLLYFFLPFPPEVMVEKYKLKKSMKICRIIAGVLFLLGVVIVILFITRVI